MSDVPTQRAAAGVKPVPSNGDGLAPFFDDFPRFYQTGNTGAGPRLNARHECVIERHREFLEGRRVIDVGSHDGRWTFAALRAGAAHVVGIEGRADLVAASRETLQAYDVPSERYALHTGDFMTALEEQAPAADTVLLLGVLYHVYEHVRLAKALRGTGATAIIIDTQLAPQYDDNWYGQTISFGTERLDSISNSPNEIYPGAGVAIIGHPSRAAVRFLFRTFGYSVTEISWGPYLEKWGTNGLEDYAEDRRATFLAVRAA